MQGGSEKGEGERARMQVLGGEHGRVRVLYLRELCHMCANCRTVCTHSLWTHSQSLALHTPSSNACPSCPSGPSLYITASQLEEISGDWFIPPQRRKQRDLSIPECPLFSSPRRYRIIPQWHVHLSQEPATSLFTLCQLKSHNCFQSLLCSNLSVWQSFADGLSIGEHTFPVLRTKLRTLMRMLGKCFVTKLHPPLSL